MTRTDLTRCAEWATGIAISLMLGTLPALGAARVELSGNLSHGSRAQVQQLSQPLSQSPRAVSEVASDSGEPQPTPEASSGEVMSGVLWFFGLSCLAMGGGVLAFRKRYPMSSAQRRRDRKRSRPHPSDQNHNIQESHSGYEHGPGGSGGGFF